MKRSINGKPAGVLLGNSGTLDIGGLLHEGENTIRIEIATTLLFAIKDPVSVFQQVAPVGLLEAPVLEYYATKGEIQ